MMKTDFSRRQQSSIDEDSDTDDTYEEQTETDQYIRNS